MSRPDKTQANLSFSGNVRKRFSNLRRIFTSFLIECVKDTGDFLCSYMKYWRVASKTDRIRSLYHPIISFSLWRRSANFVDEYSCQHDRARMLLAHNESLFKYAEQEVRQIFDFLEIDCSPRLIEVLTTWSRYRLYEATSRSGIRSLELTMWGRRC